MKQERRQQERRHTERRLKASAATDVSRIEFENLYHQVTSNVLAIRRLDASVQQLCALIERMPGLKNAS